MPLKLQTAASQFNTTGHAEEILSIQRRIRPFRHAIYSIKKNASTGGALVLTEYNKINEFGDGFVYLDSDGIGIYTFSVDVSRVKNLDNFVAEGEIVHSTVTGPILTTLFSSAAKNVISCYVYDPSTFSTIDIDGEITLIFREYYG